VDGSGGWRAKLSETLVLVLVIALVTRVVWELLAPAIPLLIGLIVLMGIYSWIFRRRDRW